MGHVAQKWQGTTTGSIHQGSSAATGEGMEGEDDHRENTIREKRIRINIMTITNLSPHINDNR